MANATTRILLGIGANLAPDGYATPRAGCEAALAALSAHNIRIVAQSRWFETAPVPISDQPWFVNAVILAETEMDAPATLAVLHLLEAEFGRQRRVRNEARVLDIDLLDYNGAQSNADNLMLPHPRMHERAFVLYPLADILPDWTHPLSGAEISSLIAALPADQTIRPMAE